ncbi:MAG: flagellar assembly protein FliW [Planctomycetota bacterium]
MLIQTTRFGPLDVDETKIMTFKDGLLGFPNHQRFALIQTAPDPAFYWMQSVDDPDLAFVVCDPLTFVPGYQVPVRQDDVDALELRDLEDCQVLVIVNKVNGDLTANLLGPIVVGAHSLRAKQMVLSDKRYGTRYRLAAVKTPQAVAKTA